MPICVFRRSGLILCQNAHRVDPGVDTIAQREIYDAVFSAKGHRRFCNFCREDSKSAALSSPQAALQSSLSFACHHPFISKLLYIISYKYIFVNKIYKLIPIFVTFYGNITKTYSLVFSPYLYIIIWKEFIIYDFEFGKV